MSTYTEDELAEAVAAAVEIALAPYRDAASLDALASAIEEATAPLAAEITELNSKLDAASLRADKAETDLADLNQFLVDAKTAEEAASALEAKRAERSEAAKAVGFSLETIEARLDRWAQLDDDVFTAMLEDVKVLSPATAKEEEPNTKIIPAVTVFQASRDDSNNTDPMKDIREFSRLARTVNVHNI